MSLTALGFSAMKKEQWKVCRDGVIGGPTGLLVGHFCSAAATANFRYVLPVPRSCVGTGTSSPRGQPRLGFFSKPRKQKQKGE